MLILFQNKDLYSEIFGGEDAYICDYETEISNIKRFMSKWEKE